MLRPAALLTFLLCACGREDVATTAGGGTGGGPEGATTTAASGTATAGTGTGGGETGGASDGGTTGADTTAGATGTGDATTGEPASDDGFVRVRPGEPAWLEVAGQGPLFVCGPGDPEDFLYRGALAPDGTRIGDQEALIAKLAATGANAIYVQAVRSHGGDGDATHNPFVGFDPAAGLSPAVLDQWEQWFVALSDAGVVVFLFLYDDGARIWSTGDDVGAEEAAFVDALVERFERVPRLVWVVAEEYGEVYSAARVSALAARIRAADGHAHPIAVHQNSGLEFDFAADPNVDMFAIQYNVDSAAALREGVAQAFAAAGGAYNLNLSEAADWGVGATSRRKAWSVATAGAYVMILGMDIASTDPADMQACGHLVRLFEATPEFVDMAPHDELALVPGSRVFAEPGAAYVVYAEQVDVLGVAGLTPGTYHLRWLDAVGGATVEQDVAVLADAALWERPAELGEEVALAIVRTSR